MPTWIPYALIAIAIIVSVAILTRWVLKRGKEGFQASVPVEEEIDPIYAIMYAADENEEQVEIPRPLAIRAYELLGPSGPTQLFGPSGPLGATGPSGPTGPTGASLTWAGYPSGPRFSGPAAEVAAKIRAVLLSDLGFYTTLFNRISVPQAAQNTEWDRDPKAATCREFGRLSQQFSQMLTELRPKIMDISGAAGQYINLKNQNMEYQEQLKAQCKRNESDACRQLAQLDESILPLMPEFEKTNDELILQSMNLTENYTAVNAIREIMQCPRENASWPAEPSGPSGPLGFNPDLTFSHNLGLIDTEILRLKLSELSPYYISPAVLNYVTEYMLKQDEMEAKVNTTRELVTEMKATSDQIKTF